MNGCCVLGRGKVYVIESSRLISGWGNNWGYYWGGGVTDYYAGRFLGNVSNLGVEINYTNQQLINRDGLIFSSECGGGLFESAGINMSVHCKDFQNLAMAFHGTSAETFTLAPPVVDQPYMPPAGEQFQEGGILVFDIPLIDTATLVVKRSDTMAVLVAGTDYVAYETNLKMLISLPPNVGLVLSFSYLGIPYQQMQAFQVPQKEYTMTFIGENIANTSEKWVATFFRVKLTPARLYNLINENFEEMQFAGILLKDHIREKQGKSPYFEIKKVTV